jgi:hypothetical protein
MSLTFLEKLEAKAEAKTGQDMVLIALRAKFKFKKVPKRIETAIRQISDPIALRSLIRNIIKCQTVDEFVKVLK